MASSSKSLSSETAADLNLVTPSVNEACDDVPLLPITTCQVPVEGSNPTPKNCGLPRPEHIKYQVLAPGRSRQFDWAGSWGWESSSMIFSVICVALLAGFLRKVNGVEYDSWDYRLSPNAVASIIATVAKSALLISVSSSLSQLKWNQSKPARPIPLYHIQVLDQASRGPWGALEVLWRWKMKPELATAGALLMVLSLAIDPLAQQLLTFPIVRLNTHDRSAYAQAAHGYPAAIFKSASQGPFGLSSELGRYNLDPNMLMAILSGLSQTSSPLEPVCVTGDCEYPDFASLGICSNCQDVTTKTIQVCEMAPVPSPFPKPLPLDCTYTSPSGYKIKPQLIHDSVNIGSEVNHWRQPWTSIITSDTSSYPLIISFFSAKYEQGLVYTVQNATIWEQKPILTECSINWCEKQYINNSYNFNSSRGLTVTQSLNLSYSYSVSVSDPSNFTGVFSPPNGSTTFLQNSNYTADANSVSNMASILKDIFNSTLIIGITSTANPALFLWNSQNLTESIAQMATAMTDVLRSTAGPDTSRIHGTTYDERAIIHVRWAWITVPAACVLMTGFFLLATAISSRKLDTILWKSSVLPLLIGQLQTRPEHDLASLPPHVSQITDMAKKIGIVAEKSHPPVMVEA